MFFLIYYLKKKEGLKLTKIIITGGAGFIGSHLVDRMVGNEHDVIVIDNMMNAVDYRNEKAQYINLDLCNLKHSKKFLGDADVVYHLAANFSIPKSTENPIFDMENNFLSTLNILESMRLNDIPRIVFTSSSTVYGEQTEFPIPENTVLKPISNYGASKVSSEIYIHSYHKLYGIEGVILRLANILGPRSNHGCVPDFVKKLKDNPKELEILGDGKQQKSYLHIRDCIDAMLLTDKKVKKFGIYNIGSEEWIIVEDIAEIVCSEMKLDPKFVFTGGNRGWKGDVPKFLLDVSKLKMIGWNPKLTTGEAIEETVRWLINENRN